VLRCLNVHMLMHKRGLMSVDALPGLTVRITNDLIDFSRCGDAYFGITLSLHTIEHGFLDVLEGFFLLKHLQHPEVTLVCHDGASMVTKSTMSMPAQAAHNHERHKRLRTAGSMAMD
jgi:hypothetical protein